MGKSRKAVLMTSNLLLSLTLALLNMEHLSPVLMAQPRAVRPARPGRPLPDDGLRIECPS